MKILIHHHAPVYCDNGSCFTQSFIARWLNELIAQGVNIGYIAHESDEFSSKLDTKISPEISFHSLGLINQGSRFKRNINIKKEVQQVISSYDYLLIRGITPRQFLIWKAAPRQKVVFLMVGSLSSALQSLRYLSWKFWFVNLLRFIQLYIISRSSAVYANGRGTALEFKKILGVDCGFIPTNTLRESEIRSENTLRNEIRTILYVGRLVEDKGIKELLLAFKKLQSTRKHLRLKLIGSLDDSTRGNRKLKKMIQEIEGVEEVGFMSYGNELLLEFQSADLFILPSYHEGFPHAIWEAFSQGVPVMATMVGGMHGTIPENSVFKIEVKSVDSICTAFLELERSLDLRKELQANGFKAVSSYTLEKVTIILREQLMRIAR